jgi:acetylornithine deacetylase
VTPPGPAEIRDAVDGKREEILAWTQALLRFPSENRPPSGNEAGAQGFLAEECRKAGWNTEEYLPTFVPGIRSHRYWLSSREYPDGRRNVAARWKGTGKGASLLFSGHVDVAPFEPDSWKVCRPFEPVVVDGRLYGRGSADMKAGLAAAYWAMRVLGDMGFRPAGDVLWESVVDEEYAGGNGTLAARLHGFNADLAVLTEPTRMRLCPACLGAFLGDITITGKAGMPFMGSEIPNPVYAAARVIALSREWQDSWRKANSHPLFREPGTQLNLMLSSIGSTAPGELIQMGTPLVVSLSWIVWCYPGMTEEEFHRRFRAFWVERFAGDPELAPFSLEITPTYHFVRPWETPRGHPGVDAALIAFREATGTEAVVSGAPFSCDMGVYGDPGGMPCIILGPHGDNLHAPDEWVELEDVYALVRIYAGLIARWSG